MSEVWYAGYGSNLSAARFACYLAGGTPEGTDHEYAGCRDRTLPRATTPLRFPGRLRFAGISTVWGGGLAYLDPDAADEVVGRGYLITTGQLDEVLAQETRYDGLVTVGERDGVPVVALVGSARCEAAAPGATYLRTILHGLTDDLLDLDAAIAYLLAAEGVGLIWDEPTIRALLEQPQSPASSPPRRGPEGIVVALAQRVDRGTRDVSSC